MDLETYSKITKDLTKEFEEFLYKANSKFNPLFHLLFTQANKLSQLFFN